MATSGERVTVLLRTSVGLPRPCLARARLEAKWQKLEKELGFPKAEILVGSIGVPESRLEHNYRFENLAAPEATFARVAKGGRMSEYQKEMAPFIVPGSHRWDILRVRED
jgi:hypothetical protein